MTNQTLMELPIPVKMNAQTRKAFKAKTKSVIFRLNIMTKPRYRRILQLLSERHMNVTELWIAMRDYSYTDITRAIQELRKAMLVTYERRGWFIYYSVDAEEINRCNNAVLKLNGKK